MGIQSQAIDLPPVAITSVKLTRIGRGWCCDLWLAPYPPTQQPPWGGSVTEISDGHSYLAALRALFRAYREAQRRWRTREYPFNWPGPYPAPNA